MLVVFLLLTVSRAADAQSLQVPVDVGLRRLAAHAISGFVEDRGAIIRRGSGGAITYALAFSISGLSDCEVTNVIATCQAYHGNDATHAASTFRQLVKDLHRSFSEKEYILISATGKEGAKDTQASYKPSGTSSEIDIDMQQSPEGFDVTLRVNPIYSL